MKLLPVIIVLVAVSSAHAFIVTPEKTDNSLAPVYKQNDLLANSRKVIEQLVASLRKTAQDTLDAVSRFTTNVQHQAQAARDRIFKDIQSLRTRVTETIENFTKRLAESGGGVRACVASRQDDATTIFNHALNKTLTCANERITELSPQLSDLKAIGLDGMEYANQTLVDMRKCTQGSEGLLAAGSCLGSVTLQAELKTLSYATRASLSMGRIGLAVATLPATLEVCAGTHLVEAGMGTSRILLEIGTCSAATVFTMMTGNAEFQSDTF